MAFDRSGVKGLPEGSNVQVIKEVPYVYFRYQWKDSTGKVKYARDYLGTVEDGQFVPNDPEFPSRSRFYTESEPLPTSLILVSRS